MELRKEYADIANRVYREWANSDIGGANACAQVALACQELADRPPRELTDAEITAIFRAEFGLGAAITYGNVKAGRTIIAAFLKKQREPETVKFRAARHIETGIIVVFPVGSNMIYHEWLEPAQEFEVKV